MREIKIKFVDFWPAFDYLKSDFYKILSKKYKIIISDTPDYIFYSVFGYEHLNYECIRIFYTGENIIPDFNICDYGIGFSNELKFSDRYLRIPLFNLFQYKKIAKIALNLHNEVGKKKTKFCNFIYSNGNADKKRAEFYNLLNSYKKVDSGGKFLNNIGGPVNDKFEFQKEYKFSIAFENSSDEGYTTEKIVEAKAAGTIPIYWGNPNITEEFNPKSFINCHDYNNFLEIIEEIKKIDKDDELFNRYQKEIFFKDENILKIYDQNLEEFLVNIIEKKKLRRSQSQATRKYTEEIKNSQNKYIKFIIRCLKKLRILKRSKLI